MQYAPVVCPLSFGLHFLRPSTTSFQREDLRPGMLADKVDGTFVFYYISGLQFGVPLLQYPDAAGRASHGSYSPLAVRVPTCRFAGM